MEMADKKCKQDSDRLLHYLRSVERERRLKSGLYRREIHFMSQKLIDSEALAENIANHAKTALSWEQLGKMYTKQSIEDFLSLPKVTLDFEKNMKKRRNKIRKIMMPSSQLQIESSNNLDSDSIKALNTSSSTNQKKEASRSNRESLKSEQLLFRDVQSQNGSSKSPEMKYSGRPTCVLPPIVGGQKKRAPRSLYQLQFLSRLDENLRQAVELPKIEHKAFSNSLRSHITKVRPTEFDR